MSDLERRIKALEEKIETMDMLTQSLKTELKKAIEDIDELNAAYDTKLLKEGLSTLQVTMVTPERMSVRKNNDYKYLNIKIFQLPCYPQNIEEY